MFFCFEGIDGAGKSTQAQMLVQQLKSDGYDAELVGDPGTTKIGTAIRQILLHNSEPISTQAQMLLFSAARAELAEYITGRQRAGAVIICDRWLLSTLVYQGVLNGISQKTILDVFNATCALLPDVCFLLDISPDAAKKRMGKPRDRYERRCMADRVKMQKAYLRLSKKGFAGTTYVLPAVAPADDTHQLVYHLAAAALKKHMSTRKQRTEASRARVKCRRKARV